MPSVTYIKKHGHAVGLTIKTQFNMETSEKLFEITGPKTLTWEYTISGKALFEVGPEVVDGHVTNVRSTVLKYWRNKFKDDVKKQCVTKMKPLEKRFKDKGDKATASDKKGFEQIASNTAEGIILAEFETFIDWASKHNIDKLGTKGSKKWASSKKIAMGGAAVGVTAVGVAAGAATMGIAAAPALLAVGMALSVLSGGATGIKSVVAARKEFRSAQEKFLRTKETAEKALDAAIKDAEDMQKKYNKLVLRQNAFGNEIEKLDAKISRLNGAKKGVDSKDILKLMKQAEEMNKQIQKDLAKLEDMGSEDPQTTIDTVQEAKDLLKYRIKVKERLIAQGAMGKLFGVIDNAASLAESIGSGLKAS